MFNFLRLLLAGVLEDSRIGYIYDKPLVMNRWRCERDDDYYHLDPETGFIIYKNEIVYEADESLLDLGRGSSGSDIHLSICEFKEPLFLDNWQDEIDDVERKLVKEEVEDDEFWPFVINYFIEWRLIGGLSQKARKSFSGKPQGSINSHLWVWVN